MFLIILFRLSEMPYIDWRFLHRLKIPHGYDMNQKQITFFLCL